MYKTPLFVNFYNNMYTEKSKKYFYTIVVLLLITAPLNHTPPPSPELLMKYVYSQKVITGSTCLFVVN